eukprot:TRINITY_DN19853_c0_g1_i1.p1 TRINITY_DN19853_c0_g1~~TRINITY_DN19853_c0_g1_i1.p1  ORF type:complete len:437 (+),score=59.04 TRINITY_DN19853_c0_g1_i1:118-1428(+)
MEDNYSQIFVDVHESDINNNNLQQSSSYTFIDLKTNLPYCRKSKPDAGVAMCDMCFQTFQTFSLLFKHKAKLCYEDGKFLLPYQDPIKISFHKDHLFYIGDVISSLELLLHDDLDKQDHNFIIVDQSMFEITLRRFYFGQITKYNIEQWYPSLAEIEKRLGIKQLTAKTIILNLIDDELKLISTLASVHLSQSLGMGSHLTNDEMERQQNFEDKIDLWMNTDLKSGTFTNGDAKVWFCRLSSRSPKDGVAVNLDPSESLEVRMEKKIKGLQVRNGQEILNLLQKSQRIFSDISMYFQYRVPNCSSGTIALILREWMNQIPQDHEFRCYVHNKQLNAISQYHCYYRFEALQNVEHAEKIKETIVKYHDQIKDYLPFPSYVIDVVVLEDYVCQVIELNPFGADMSSGAALFNWEKDHKLLYGELNRSSPAIRILNRLK